MGKIVSPRGNSSDVKWHSVFLPNGSDVTVSEMTDGAEREECLPRGAAIRALEVRMGVIGKIGWPPDFVPSRTFPPSPLPTTNLEKDEKLSEGQAGFRPNRGSVDHVYTLGEIIQGRRDAGLTRTVSS